MFSIPFIEGFDCVTYFEGLALVNRSVPTLNRGDRQDCMLLHLSTQAYGEENEDYIRVCICVYVLFLKYGMQQTISLFLLQFLAERDIVQTHLYVICIGSPDFILLNWEAVKH